MTVGLDTEKANEAIRSDSLGKLMQAALEPLKPEAAYFGAKDGRRTGFIVFDLHDPSDMPSVAEPFFLELNAKIDVTPVMDFADVQKGLQKFGSQ